LEWLIFVVKVSVYSGDEVVLEEEQS